MIELHAGDAANGLGQILNTIQSIEDHAGMSLTQYVRRSIISSRVFVENNLAGEEILVPLMLNLMNLYAGFVVTAMGMNQYISNTQRVRDIMSVVATEDFKIKPTDTKTEMKAYFAIQDDIDDVLSTPKIQNDFGDTSAAIDHRLDATEPRPESTLPSGRIVKVDFAVGQCKFSVNMLLQLQPIFIPSDVAKAFISINFTPSIRQRWMQVSAGEISFFNDLILGRDLRQQRLKALKDDKDGILQQMLDRQSNALSNAWLKYAQITPERQNIANTILIFEKASFDKACNSAGLKITNYSNRQKFFNKTFSLMIVVVDVMYNKVTVYYHGLTDPSVFTFGQLKKNAKVETTDILAMMKNYAQGMAPKF